MKKVPELRFKEFTDEWEEKKLGEITEIKGGYAFKSSKFLNKISKYQVIKMGNLYQNKLLLDRNPSFMSKIFDKEEQYLLKKNDIILTLTGTVGKRDFGYSYKIKNEKNLLLNQRLACIRVKSMEYNTDFIKEIIRNEKFLNDFFELSIGGTGNQANVSIKDIENIEIIIPLYKEQQKISDFLSAVDEKIEKSEKKIELLKDYKKGMMQKIFSQEVRFKDENGNDYPAWEEKKLGEISNISTGKLDANAMVKEGRYRFYTCAKEFYYIDNFSFDTEALLISGNGANVGYIHYYKGKFNAYQRTYVLDKFKENIIFIKYILEKNLKLRIEKEKNSGNTPYIVLSVLSDMKLELPILEEQQKIADFLSVIDEKIEKEEKKVEELKEFKKGLLQKMFV